MLSETVERQRTSSLHSRPMRSRGAEDEVCSARRIKFERWLSLFR
jgi:hypothetical protein